MRVRLSSKEEEEAVQGSVCVLEPARAAIENSIWIIFKRQIIFWGLSRSYSIRCSSC